MTRALRHDELPAARFDLADLGFLLSDPSRATILLALMDGSSRPASELARIAGVSAQTASAHFGRLVGGGLVAVEQEGRNRFYRLKDAGVAAAVEALLAIPGLPPARAERLRRDPRGETFCRARTCYSHLAGTVAVAIADAWLDDGWLAPTTGARAQELTITARGHERLRDFGIDTSALRRPTRACIDLTERRPHLGGALGAALLAHAFDERWLERARPARAVLVTARGARALARHGIVVPG